MSITQSRARDVAAHQDAALRCGRALAAHHLNAELAIGAARHIAYARACERDDGAERGRFINCAVSMLHALRADLDLASGDTMAANLDDLYEYMSAQLCAARNHGGSAPLDEVDDLLNEIRMAWFAVPQHAAARTSGAS
jgi:flagellar protein FliS